MWASAVVCQGSGQGGERRAEDLEAGRKGWPLFDDSDQSLGQPLNPPRSLRRAM